MSARLALIRAVNVGSTRALKIADLRTLLTAIGVIEIKTYIASGNAVLRHDADSAQLRDEIKGRLRNYTDAPVGVSMLTCDQIDTVRAPPPLFEADLAALGILLPIAQFLPPRTSTRGDKTETISGGPGRYVHHPDGRAAWRSKPPLFADGTMCNLRNVRAVTDLPTDLATNPK